MISILIIWILMFSSMYLFGKQLLDSFSKKIHSWDKYVIVGMIFMAVYAQTFSLFYKVGILAWVFLGIGLIFLIGKYLKQLKVEDIWKYLKNADKFKVLLCISVVVTGGIWSCQAPEFGDTYLYHAQSIRWVEEYGIVCGLGNLHSRFAYNSVFFPLQALYSFSWLGGQSFHSLNGFVCVFFSLYAILSLKKDKSATANLLRVMLLVYTFMNRNFFSSTTSDMLALLLFIWININWIEDKEEQIRESRTSLFVIICAFAITVKISVLSCAILVIVCAWDWFKEKSWKRIFLCVANCLIVVIPYFVRGVISSGYLLYPYSKLDLFNVDWKMLASIADYDSMTITVWGRGLNDINRYHDSLVEWIPIWFGKADLFGKLCIIGGCLASIFLIIYAVYCVVKKEKYNFVVLVITDIAGLLVWFWGAPLLRYGIVFLLVLICLAVGVIIQFNINNRIMEGILLIYLVGALLSFNNWNDISILLEKDYIYQEGIAVKYEGITFYEPSEDTIGYHLFPSADDELEIIELRGGSLEEGFRIKEIYKDSNMSYEGTEW